MVSHRDPILASALRRFALDGFSAASVQHIADDAGASKANVLYHFASKDDLLAHALTPTLDEFDTLVSSIDSLDGMSDPQLRTEFIDRFVPFLLRHRLGVHIIVTHAHLAPSHPPIARALGLMARIAAIVERSSSSDLDALRFGVALSGATYTLVSETLLGMDALAPAELESGLKVILTEMLVPASETAGR
jgi:AcrR family transcriptional regulator